MIKRKKRFLAFLMSSIVATTPLLGAGCFSVQKTGATWYTGTEYMDSQGEIGDFFYDTDDNTIYQKTENGWKLISNLNSSGSAGTDGDYIVLENLNGVIRWKYSKESDNEYRTLIDTTTMQGSNGDSVVLRVENGAIEWKYSKADDSTYQSLITLQSLRGDDGKDVEFNFDGRYIEWRYKGETTYTDLVDTIGWQTLGQDGKSAYEIAIETGFNGTKEEWLQSLKGKDGISSYVGYDGYLWNGTERTEYSVGASLASGVVENTIGIEGVMSNYFKGGYLDLSSSTVALMSNYMPNIKVTQYGDTCVNQIKVVAEKEGFLHIGKAKVIDIASAKTTGTAFTAETTAYTVQKGLNIISLNIVLQEDETIILGGKNSVGLYYAQGINIADEQGNFTLLNGKTDLDIISKTNGAQDTIAIQVSAVCKKSSLQALQDIQEKCPTDISSLVSYSRASCPFAYSSANYFSNKKIIKIGAPIKTLKDYTKDQVLTIYKINKSTTSNFAENYTGKYTLTIPANTYTSNTVNAWHYFDTNIVVGENESLAFFSSTDDVMLGYVQSVIDNELKFYTTLGAEVNYNIFFDVIYQTSSSDKTQNAQVLEDIEKKCPTDIDSLVGYSRASCPFAYSNANYFSGKTIVKIGAPIKTLKDYTQAQVFTVYKINKFTTSNFAENYTGKYTLTIPANTYTSNTVNAWHYFDTNIVVGENESLAFFSSTDDVMLGYVQSVIDNELKFYTTLGAEVNYNIFFDVIYEKDIEITYEQHIKNIQDKEGVAAQKAKEQELANLLAGKNFSILGDSISTFIGYSNDATNTNSTIGSNAVWYDTELAVTDTWWKQTADLTKMNVLVDNAYSGDTIENAKNSRCVNLHDNTGSNAGTNPDIIAFYMGVNDIKNDASLSVETFRQNYLTIVEKMMSTYKNADIFVFTIPQYNYANPRTDAELNAYNNVIREIAQSKGLGLVDLFANSGITTATLGIYTIDNLHPNATGMDLITKCFMDVLYNTYLN